MPGYDYLQPDSISEALEAKLARGDQAVFVMGATDVLPLYRAGRMQFDTLISLRGIKSLRTMLETEDGELVIGSGVTLSELLENPVVQQRLPILHDAITRMGCTQMRNLATLGGNLMNALSSGDTLPSLLCLEATCLLVSPRGERSLPITEIFTGPRRTAAGPDEILKEVVIKLPPENASGAFDKIGRRKALDLAVVNLAAQLELAADGAIAAARLAAGAVGPTPLRLPGAEKLLSGARPEPELLARAAQAAQEEVSPWDDIRASAWYRRELIKVMLPRVCRAALARLGFETA